MHRIQLAPRFIEGSKVWTFLSPKGMDKSALGCAERTTLGRGPVPLAASLKGMNTPRRLLSIPFRDGNSS
jgi:hypothetical protein